MPPEIGAKLGPYEIIGNLGAGGMGEVWKARDTRLHRTVAIKTSAAAFSERFGREARAFAALNHPNICQLYDVGPDYLVLEYVEGVPVGPTDNVRRLLDLAVQIADGMAAAHAAGFVHRDLKPSNVLVTQEGRVKILDFGLAKNIAPQTQAAGAERLTVTATGFVAGTAAYMSPEQIGGSSDIDARSDQFSFGLLLYEMAAGRQAFERTTAVETLAAIMRDDPAPLPCSLPAPLRWIIERCLAKDRRERYESSRDLYLELRTLRDRIADASATQEHVAMLAAPRRRHWRSASAFAAGALLMAGLALVLGLRELPSPELRFVPLSFEPGGQTDPVWSRDGRAVAFRVRQRLNEPWQLSVRYLDSPVAIRLTRTADNVVPIQWTSTDRIIFQRTPPRTPPMGLWSISPVGGEPEPFFAYDENVAAVPAVSRDGSAVAVLRQDEAGQIGLWLSSPPSAPGQRYAPAPFEAPGFFNVPSLSFSPDGRQLLLVWTPQNTEAWLLPFPPDAANPPRRVLVDLMSALPVGTPEVSWMADSRHVVVAGTPTAASPRRLYVADTAGGDFRVLSSGTTDQIWPAVSPASDKLAFVEGDRDFDIVTIDLVTAAVTPLIATSRKEQMPAWSAATAALVYVTDRNGGPEIWLHEPGEPDRPLVTADDFPQGTTQFFMGPELSPDGNRVIYLRFEVNPAPAARAGQLWMSAVAGGAPVPLVRDETPGVFTGTWSPDGGWYVYRTVDRGFDTIRKVRTTGQAQSEILKNGVRRGGVQWVPTWSPSGDWILYPDGGRNKLVSADGQTTRDLGPNAVCAFARDGRRLYCLREVLPDGSRPLVSIDLNGADEQKVGSVPVEYLPTNELNPALHITITPEGNAITYSVLEPSTNLWLLEGLDTVPLP